MVNIAADGILRRKARDDGKVCGENILAGALRGHILLEQHLAQKAVVGTGVLAEMPRTLLAFIIPDGLAAVMVEGHQKHYRQEYRQHYESRYETFSGHLHIFRPANLEKKSKTFDIILVFDNAFC